MLVSIMILGMLFVIFLLWIIIRLLWELKEDVRFKWCQTTNKQYKFYLALINIVLTLTVIICLGIPIAFAFLILFLFA